jgi:hypothetical protein
LLATLLAVIPKVRRHGLRLLVTPDTILRWHRDIIRRRWASRSIRSKTGRPATRSPRPARPDPAPPRTPTAPAAPRTPAPGTAKAPTGAEHRQPLRPDLPLAPAPPSASAARPVRQRT